MRLSQITKPLRMALRTAMTTAVATAALTAGTLSAGAQSTAPDTIVVFDGSGSMWGQIDGRAKIEIARDTLSSVLSESVNDMRIGMIAYGHRQKGQCSDIETIVPVGPAQSTVPAMINAARSMQPKGKTPLTDAVRRAADELRSTENAATVVLVTDGIETCNADPCALASELERSSVNFTAHVVGFGLSAEEGRKVACLADNTGGLYIQADDANDLTDALQRTIEPIPANEDDFEDDELTPRQVVFTLRDAQGTDPITGQSLAAVFQTADGEPVRDVEFIGQQHAIGGVSGRAMLPPGDYRMLITRASNRAATYRTAIDITVPPGDGDHAIDMALSGMLVIDTFINPTLPFDPADPPISARDTSWAYFEVFAVENGKAADEHSAKGYKDLRFPLPAGDYLIRASIDRSFGAEKLVTLTTGAPTQVDFSFDLTPVTIDTRDADGFPRADPLAFVYDGMPGVAEHLSRGRNLENPFYLAAGTWAVDAGTERRGVRSRTLVTVPGDFQPITLRMDGSEELPADAESRITKCMARLRVKYEGCLMKPVDLSANADPADIEPTPAPAPDIAPAPAPAQNGDGRPAELAGLKGDAYAFADASGRVVLHVVIEDGREAATIVLSGGWCGTTGCAGLRGSVQRDDVSSLETTSPGLSSMQIAGGQFDLISLGDEQEMRISLGGQKARLTLMDRIVLAATGNDPAAVDRPEPVQKAEARPTAARITFISSFARENVADLTVVAGEPSRLSLDSNWCKGAGTSGTCPRVNIALGEDILTRLAKREPETITQGNYKMTLAKDGRPGTIHLDDGTQTATIQAFKREDLIEDKLVATQEYITPQGDAFPIPKGAAGLSGKGTVFTNSRDMPLLLVLPETGDGTAMLARNWCANDACAEQTFSIPRAALEAFEMPLNAPVKLSDTPVTMHLSPTQAQPELVAQRPDGTSITFSFAGTGEVRDVPEAVAPALAPGADPNEGKDLTLVIAELEKPVGLYAMLDTETVDAVSKVGEAACMSEPAMVDYSGSIYFQKSTGDAAKPYEMVFWMGCRGEGSCTMHRGSPDAPDPVASVPAIDYRALGNGHFAACTAGQPCRAMYACVRPGSGITLDSKTSSGAPLVETMMKAAAPYIYNTRYLDNATIFVPW